MGGIQKSQNLRCKNIGISQNNATDIQENQPMKKVILTASTVAYGLLIFYLNHFQANKHSDDNLMTFLVILLVILTFLHIKVYKK